MCDEILLERSCPWITHLEKCRKGVVAEGLWEACPKRLAGTRIVTQPEIATNDVLEESDRLRLDELVDHVTKDGADGKEALVGVTDIREPGFVKKNLLHDKDCNRLGEFRTGLHDAETEGDDLGGEKEVYHCVVVILLRREDEGEGRSRRDCKMGHTLTRAPMTPRDVRRRYSKGRVLDVVFKKGYKKRGICAVIFFLAVSVGGDDGMEEWWQVPFKKSCLVSGWDATHWRSARALQTRLDTCAVRFGGESIGYTETIS